ncbi:MAG: GIY-YIG nuclease family protein [Calditrichaeota bacterium]|nr:GIY-YIG nuclease family protein [Calditrichota bacterium]
MDEKTYCVYILSSLSRSIYTGMTNDLRRRVLEHKRGEGSTHAAKYRITRLVHFESYSDIRRAIAREKEVKDWTREKRVQLIETYNLGWLDLAENWYETEELERE